MNKLDLRPRPVPITPALDLNAAAASSLGKRVESTRRLIVLFPASELDTPELEQRIWEIARSLHLNILLVSLINDFDEETQVRRNLVTMAAVIKDPYVSTDILIAHGNDWVRQVRKIWQAGDVVACFAGQRVGAMRKPLDQLLKSSLGTTIYILADYRTPVIPNRTFLSQFLFWSGALAIIAGFFWAEVRIGQMPQDWAHAALIYVCIFVEVVIIFVWNSLFA